MTQAEVSAIAKQRRRDAAIMYQVGMDYREIAARLMTSRDYAKQLAAAGERSFRYEAMCAKWEQPHD